jgi:hypothetical protein
MGVGSVVPRSDTGYPAQHRYSVGDGRTATVSGIHPGYSCKEGRIVEDRLLVEFPCTPTRTRSVYSY